MDSTFQDWASILSFTEAAVRHSWGQLPDHLSQEKCSAHKDNAHVRETNVKEGTGVVTTLRDISESPRLMAKRCKVFHHDKSQSYLSPFNDLVSVSILNPSCHEKVSVNLSEGQKAITGTIKYLRVGYSSEGMTSAGCNIAGENNQFQTQKVWGNDIIFSSKSAIASLPVESLKWTDESKNGPMSRLKWTKYSDGDSDLRDELRGSTSRHGRSNYGEINREFLLQSKQNKRLKRVIPETFTFPGDAPNKSESSLSLQEYEKQSADFMTDMEWPSSSKGSDFAYLGFTDGNVDFIGKEKLQGRNSSYLMSIDMTKDHQTAKQLSMFPDDLVDSCPFSERCSRRQSYRLDALPQHVGHMETLCEAVEAKHYLSSLSSGNAGLEAKSYQLQDEAGHRYFMGMSYNEMKHEIGRDKLAENSFDEDWLPNSSGAGANLENQNWSSFGPDVEIFRGSVLPSNRNASSKKPKFVKKTKNRILNYNGKVDNHIHYHIFEHVDRESSHYVRRSCSAPPHYRGKQKFSVLTSPPAAAAVPELNLTIVNDFPILSAHCERKGLGQKSDISELAEPVLLSTCHSHLRKCTKKPQYRSMTEHKLHFENGSSSEGNVPTKWRNGEPEPKWDPVNDVMVVENMGNASSDYLDGVLDISSGLLFLSGNYLVPESVSKEYLEGAKVLQQVDRKFIPITAGGILAVVDQHAADERIRLEELRQNVLSGEGKSVSYLEYGKELVLPEFGFQLLQNYTDQISHWGWICDIHTDSMSSFTRNLNLLHQQAVTVTLIAVPCILGINLSEKDLLEFLDQLADTDGSSLMPPAVVRILNYRACRGAIMFGDSLFPSECSLIVDALKRTSLCFQCAHGRPTTVPLVNLEALHEQLNRLNSSHSEAAESWHGLRHYAPSIERVKMRLAAARSHG